MTDQEPHPHNNQEENYARVEMLAVTTNDPIVRRRWEFAVDRFGYAFVAFSQLQLPELYTDEAIPTFEDLFGGSFNDLTEAAVMQIDSLGWKEALYRLRRDEGITDDLLVWDYAAVIEQLSQVYEIRRAGGKMHLFAR
jgi:hypothetical protein